MTVYLAMLAVALVITYWVQNKRFVNYRPKNKKIVNWVPIIIVAIPFLIVSGLRADTVGMDYRAYTVSYFNYGNMGIGREQEILGSLIIKFARAINWPVFIIWVYAVVNCIGTAYWICKKSNNWTLSVFLFFITGTFNWSLNIMRQTSAMLLVFIGLEFICKDNLNQRDKIYFAVIVLIASFFHKMALLYFIMLVFPYKIFAKHFKIFVCLLAVLPFVSMGIRSLILVVSQKLNFYYRYFNNYYDQGTYTGSLIFATIACFSVILITYSQWKNNKKEYYVMAAVQYLSVAFSLIANILPNNARVTYLFYPIAIVAIPEFVSFIKKKNRLWVSMGIILMLGVFYTSSYVMNNWGETIPYRWMFQ